MSKQIKHLCLYYNTVYCCKIKMSYAIESLKDAIYKEIKNSFVLMFFWKLFKLNRKLWPSR